MAANVEKEIVVRAKRIIDLAHEVSQSLPDVPIPLTPEQTQAFLTIALAAGREDGFIDYRGYKPLLPDHMSSDLLTLDHYKTPLSLILVGPTDVIRSLSPTVHSVGLATMVDVPLAENRVTEIRFAFNGTLKSIRERYIEQPGYSLPGTQSFVISPDGTIDTPSLWQQDMLRRQSLAFSMVFIESSLAELRGQMRGIDVYLLPEIPSVA